MAFGIAMTNCENQERDIDAVIRTVRQYIPELKVTQLQKMQPNDDDNLWWFSLPDIVRDIQVENASCPLLIETDEQSSSTALKATSIQQAVTMIVDYLTAIKEGRPLHLNGQPYWK